MACYVHWCRHLDSLPDVKPQLCVDNLECSAERPLSMSGLSVRICLLVSVFFSAPPSLLGRP